MNSKRKVKGIIAAAIAAASAIAIAVGGIFISKFNDKPVSASAAVGGGQKAFVNFNTDGTADYSLVAAALGSGQTSRVNFGKNGTGAQSWRVLDNNNDINEIDGFSPTLGDGGSSGILLYSNNTLGTSLSYNDSNDMSGGKQKNTFWFISKVRDYLNGYGGYYQQGTLTSTTPSNSIKSNFIGSGYEINAVSDTTLKTIGYFFQPDTMTNLQNEVKGDFASKGVVDPTSGSGYKNGRVTIGTSASDYGILEITTDKLYLLDYDDMFNTRYGFKANANGIAINGSGYLGDVYGHVHGNYSLGGLTTEKAPGINAKTLWARTCGMNRSGSYAFAYNTSSIGDTGMSGGNWLRPALNLNPEKIVFATTLKPTSSKLSAPGAGESTSTYDVYNLYLKSDSYTDGLKPTVFAKKDGTEIKLNADVGSTYANKKLVMLLTDSTKAEGVVDYQAVATLDANGKATFTLPTAITSVANLANYRTQFMVTSSTNITNGTEEVYAAGSGYAIKAPGIVKPLTYDTYSQKIEDLTDNTDPDLSEMPQWYKDIKEMINPLSYTWDDGNTVGGITPWKDENDSNTTEVKRAGKYLVKVELLTGLGEFAGPFDATKGESETLRYITLTVEQKEIDLIWKRDSGGDTTNFNYDYDGAKHVPDVDWAPGQTPTPTGSITVKYKDSSDNDVTDPKNNGTYTATAALSTADAINFKIKSGSEARTFSIGAKQLTKDNIKWGTETYTYDGTVQTFPTAQYSIDNVNFNDLDVELSDSTQTFKDVGTYKFTVKLKAGDNNVTLPSAASDKTAEYTIERAPLTIVWKTGDDAKFTYSDSNPAMVSDLTGFITGEETTFKADFINEVEGKVSYSIKTVANNGKARLMDDLEVGSNYKITKDTTGATYEIGRAELQVEAENVEIAMGETPKLTALLIGLQGSDDTDDSKKKELQNAVNAALTAKNYTTTSPKGEYDIELDSTETGSDYVLKNYVISFTGAKLTVKAGKIKVTFEGHTAVQYGTKKEDALKGVTITVDKYNAADLTIETDYTATMAAGTEYKFTVTFKNADDAENYSVEYVNDKYTVAKRVITAADVKFSDFTQVYDGKPHSATAEIKIDGLDITPPALKVVYEVKNGDGTSLESVTNAATYVATADFAAANGNWEFKDGNVATTEITVTPAPLNITLAKPDYTVEYGEELDINDIELSFGGIIAGEETAIKEAFEISAKDGKGKPYTTAAVPSDTKFTVLATLSDKNAVSNYAITGLDETTGVLTGVSGTLQVLKKKINVQVDYTSLDFGGEVTGKLTDGISIGGKTYDELVDSGIYEFTFYFTPAGGEPQVIGDISQHPQVGEDGKINMMGEYSFTVSLTDYGAARYDWAGTALHEDVSLAEVAGDGSVRVTVTAEGWAYGETVKQPTVTTMPATDGGTAFTVEIEWYDGTNWNKWTESQPKNAGTYSVRARTKASANYPASSWKTGSLVIAPKTLTVKVAMNEENTEVKAGTATTELTKLWTVTATGFVGEDTYDFTAFAENYSATTAAGTEINVKITRAELTGVLANYEIVYEENAKFTVIENDEPVTPPVEDPPTDDPNTDKPNEDDPKPVEPGVTDNNNNKGLPDDFPLWQVIVGSVSIVLSVAFIAKICFNISNASEYKRKASGAYAGAMVNGMLFGISNTCWTVIALSLAGLAVILFVIMLITGHAMKKARRACEAEDKRRHDEEMKMIMMMLNGNKGGGATYAAPAGATVVGLSDRDLDAIASRVTAALLPNMQQAAAQLTAGGGEYNDAELKRRLSESERRIEELEGRDDGFDDVIEVDLDELEG